jgi:hypothetical protein
MALILVLVFGVVAAAMATYGEVSFRHHLVVRLQTALRSSAEAGLRVGLDKLRLHSTLCADAPASVGPQTVSVPITPNGASITLTCSYVSGNLPQANEWGAVLTGIGTSASVPELSAEGANSTAKSIDGPVYLASTSPSASVASLAAPVTINDGDLWYFDPTCAPTTNAPTISGLTLLPSPPRSRLCTTQTWSAIAPQPVLPPKPLPIDPPARDDLVPGCRIFFPGSYSAPPALQKGDNYFVSGDYYFDFDGTLDIKSADVQAGQPDPYSGDVAQLSGLTSQCAHVLDNDTVKAAEIGYGATFVLGGASTIAIDTHGRLEMFSREQLGGQNVSIQAVETTGAGYDASTITTANGPIVWMKPGNTNAMVLHGLLRAPKAQVAFGNVTNTVSAQAAGGLVVASLDLQGSASASGWLIGRANRPTATKVVMTATATDVSGISVSVQAVVDYRFARLATDAATYAGSNVLAANTASFTSHDVGSVVVGTMLPPQTHITSVLTPSIVLLSANATATTTAQTVTIRTAEVAINSWRRI